MHDKFTAIQPAELLEALESYSFLANYHLSLFCEERSATGATSPDFKCFGRNKHMLCNSLCEESLGESIAQAIRDNRPNVFHCRVGLIFFAVPLQCDTSQNCCIVGCGVREESLNLPLLETIAGKTGKPDLITLVEELGELPTATNNEVQEITEKLHNLIPSLQMKNIYTQMLDKAMQQLTSIQDISSEIDRMETVDDLLHLCTEAFSILFNLTRLVIVLQQKDGNSYTVKGEWGVAEGSGSIPTNKLLKSMAHDPSGKPIRVGKEIRLYFPEIEASSALCLPIISRGEFFGAILLFDAEEHPRDMVLLELLNEKIAIRLSQIIKADERQNENTLSARFLSVITTLSFLETKEDLYKNMLEMAADLVQASSGSLMLMDDAGENLRIQWVKGMNQQLAKSIRIPVGKNIAGKVARSAQPLLVHDIEKDSRCGIQNRPRFKTKSFVSIPFRLKGKVAGVLNLSDKQTGQQFTEADITLLSSFTEHVCTMVGRVESLEMSSQFEELSLTDHLTGIYNRRFLTKRMEEELNRCSRHDLNLTILFLDLDHFKKFNDTYGHLAGDEALKQIAALLSSAARQMDIVARYGGEEFCIILPNTTKKQSVLLAERIRRAVENESFYTGENLPVGKMTVSIGVASYPEDGDTLADLVKGADIALYQAKAKGRNCVLFFNREMEGNVMEQKTHGVSGITP